MMKDVFKKLEDRKLEQPENVKGGSGDKATDFKIPEKVVMEKDTDFYG